MNKLCPNDRDPPGHGRPHGLPPSLKDIYVTYKARLDLSLPFRFRSETFRDRAIGGVGGWGLSRTSPPHPTALRKPPFFVVEAFQ